MAIAGARSMDVRRFGGVPFVNQGGGSTGWTAGGGIDYAITERIIARIAYRYTDLATATFASQSARP
jgi:outer membrane immunogenic protein